MVTLEDGVDRMIEFLSRTQRCRLQLSLLEDICSFDRAKTEKLVDSDDILYVLVESCEWELLMAKSDYENVQVRVASVQRRETYCVCSVVLPGYTVYESRLTEDCTVVRGTSELVNHNCV